MSGDFLAKTIQVFISYAHEDAGLREELAKFLKPLKQDGTINDWYDGNISPGQKWEPKIYEQLKKAQIILLLISQDFLASDFCSQVEVEQAIERDRAGTARVIPIILRPVEWEHCHLNYLQALPQNAKPITKWENQDEAFVDVARGIRKAITDLKLQLLAQYVTNILNQDPQTVLQKSIADLITILCKIEDFNLALEAFFSTLKLFGNHDSYNIKICRSREIQAIQNSKNKDALSKISLLFKLLLEDYPCQPKIQGILNFCSCLKTKDIAPNICAELEGWLEAVKQEYGYEPILPISHIEETNKTEPELEAYLMIIFKPVKPSNSNKFFVDGFLQIGKQPPKLIPDLGQFGQDGKFTIEEAKKQINYLINESLKQVVKVENELNYQQKSITLEVFLPRQYLAENVDQWGREMAGREVPFGKDYKFIVRLYERIAHLRGDLDEPNALTYFNYLQAKWKKFEQFLKDNPNESAIKNRIKCLSTANQLEKLQERELRTERLGIKLSCNLSKSHQEKLFSFILRTGIPIALWVRQDRIHSVKKTTDEFLRQEYLTDLSKLLERIRQERERAYDEKSELGRHLAVLCDNPTRLPPELTPMQTSEPLPFN